MPSTRDTARVYPSAPPDNRRGLRAARRGSRCDPASVYSAGVLIFQTKYCSFGAHSSGFTGYTPGYPLWIASRLPDFCGILNQGPAVLALPAPGAGEAGASRAGALASNRGWGRSFQGRSPVPQPSGRASRAAFQSGRRLAFIGLLLPCREWGEHRLWDRAPALEAPASAQCFPISGVYSGWADQDVAEAAGACPALTRLCAEGDARGAV